jgi:hypothetical protein
VDTAEQFFGMVSKVLPIGVARHLVDTGGSSRVDRPVGRPEPRQVDVVQQCG